jgi:hypothetical protein
VERLREETEAARTAERDRLSVEREEAEATDRLMREGIIRPVVQESNSRAKAKEMMASVLEMQRVKETLVQQAESEMQKMLSRTKLEAERIRKEQSLQLQIQLQEGEQRLVEMEREESDAKQRIRQMREDLTKLRDNLSEMIAGMNWSTPRPSVMMEVQPGIEADIIPTVEEAQTDSLISTPPRSPWENDHADSDTTDEWAALRARLMKAKRDIEAV